MGNGMDGNDWANSSGGTAPALTRALVLRPALDVSPLGIDGWMPGRGSVASQKVGWEATRMRFGITSFCRAKALSSIAMLFDFAQARLSGAVIEQAAMGGRQNLRSLMPIRTSQIQS